MQKSKNKKDSLPRHFGSIDEAAEFWDSHDLTDYWDHTQDAEFEADIQRRIFLTALEPGLSKKLTDFAWKQGISTETLINLWLGEKLTSALQAG